jgi:ABC-type transporter Mla MlaB component
MSFGREIRLSVEMCTPANPMVLAIEGPVARADVPGLCDRVRALLGASPARVLVCDLGGSVRADAATIDALARVQLTAKRLGRRMRLRNAPAELRALLTFFGLDGVLRVEAVGKAEERKERLRVEEERELADPAVRDLDDL